MVDLRKGPRGLPSIAHAREVRAHRGPTWTMQAGLVAGGAVIAGFVAHLVVSARDLSSTRDALLAKERAVAATVGAEWFPLRDRVEAEIASAAQPYPGDHIEPEARAGQFRTQPGVYLRLRLADAAGGHDIGQIAAGAKRDAFVACFLHEPNERVKHGDFSGGAIAEQPWNLGQVYAATRILTEDWVRAVKDADEAMRLRVFSEQYDKAIRDEIPLAIEIVKRAQFFLLVIDEDVADANGAADGGPMTEEALQLLAHPARVTLLDLRSNKELLRIRRSGGALVVPAGERQVTDPETLSAMQRQANNCALAGLVDDALSRSSAAAER